MRRCARTGCTTGSPSRMRAAAATSARSPPTSPGSRGSSAPTIRGRRSTRPSSASRRRPASRPGRWYNSCATRSATSSASRCRTASISAKRSLSPSARATTPTATSRDASRRASRSYGAPAPAPGPPHLPYTAAAGRVPPRVALVWRASDRHILKAQYTEGFPPPTFFELYTPVPPGRVARYAFEVNATTELNYVFRAANSVGRATLFRSVISNMIRPGGFLTDPNARAEGVELEWSEQVAPPLKFDANVSYVDTVDPRQPGPGFPERSNPIASPWLANLSLFYRPLAGLVFGARVSYGSDPEQAEGRRPPDPPGPRASRAL